MGHCFAHQNSCNTSSATRILYDPPLGFHFRSPIIFMFDTLSNWNVDDGEKP
ncbi:hypothetical protein GBA52_014816 [Prunus armeniaca]|nr:hypothetical protein GBA52_014816 [Prunus armeniaca]